MIFCLELSIQWNSTVVHGQAATPPESGTLVKHGQNTVSSSYSLSVESLHPTTRGEGRNTLQGWQRLTSQQHSRWKEREIMENHQRINVPACSSPGSPSKGLSAAWLDLWELHHQALQFPGVWTWPWSTNQSSSNGRWLAWKQVPFHNMSQLPQAATPRKETCRCNSIPMWLCVLPSSTSSSLRSSTDSSNSLPRAGAEDMGRKSLNAASRVW